jgi:hypothetical protein
MGSLSVGDDPMSTSNYYDTGHRIGSRSRAAISLCSPATNTGGKNYDETEGIVAHNSVPTPERTCPKSDAVVGTNTTKEHGEEYRSKCR